MDSHKIIPQVIVWIETHLHEKPDLKTIAVEAGYSPYHLHRMFTETTGITLHAYIRRRQLTEAARLLVETELPVMEIACLTGYESQQSFTTAFRAMYKQTPLAFRRNAFFYPLQLRYVLHSGETESVTDELNLSRASPEDISDWMEFTAHVIAGFPRLERSSHLEQVKRHVETGQAILMRRGKRVIGAAAFSTQTGSIDFLAEHPQYRRSGTAQAIVDHLRRGPFAGREISITTFRAGDRADPGQRDSYQRLGFLEAEELTVFGYPVQRLVLPPVQGENGHAG